MRVLLYFLIIGFAPRISIGQNVIGPTSSLFISPLEGKDISVGKHTLAVTSDSNNTSVFHSWNQVYDNGWLRNTEYKCRIGSQLNLDESTILTYNDDCKCAIIVNDSKRGSGLADQRNVSICAIDNGYIKSIFESRLTPEQLARHTHCGELLKYSEDSSVGFYDILPVGENLAFNLISEKYYPYISDPLSLHSYSYNLGTFLVDIKNFYLNYYVADGLSISWDRPPLARACSIAFVCGVLVPRTQ